MGKGKMVLELARPILARPRLSLECILHIFVMGFDLLWDKTAPHKYKGIMAT